MAAGVTAFIRRYYDLTELTPELASINQFYQELSSVSRPGPDGELKSASTLDGIHELFTSSPKLKDFVIMNVHEQVCVLECVFAVVMGYVRGEDEVRSNFIHSFLLAPRSWHMRRGGDEFVDEHHFLILNDALFLFRSGDPLKQVMPLTSPISAGKRSQPPRTYASVLGTPSPPGQGGFPPLPS